MTARHLLAAALLLLLAAATAWAQERIRVGAAFDRDTINLGESVALRVVVDGADSADGPDPSEFGEDVIATFEDGTNRSSTMIEIVNGRRSERVERRYVLTYTVTPRRGGRLTVPELSVRVGGTEYATAPMDLLVREPAPAESARLEVSLSRERVHVEAPVEIVLEVQLLRPRLDEEWLDLDPWYPERPLKLQVPWFAGLPEAESPEFVAWARTLLASGGERGFSINDLKDNQGFFGRTLLTFRLPRAQRSIGGRSWFTYTLRKVVQPTRTGVYDIPTSSLIGEVVTKVRRSGSSLAASATERVFVSHDPVRLEVLPVPTQDRPPTYAHAVGRYTVRAKVSPQRASVGDPLQLDLEIQGEGLIGNVRPPLLAAQESLTRDFVVGESSNPAETEGGVRRFYFTIRPKRAGQLEIPPIEFAHFDPRTEEFRIATSEPLRVEVVATSEVGASDIVNTGSSDARASTPGEERAGGLLGNRAVSAMLRDDRFDPLASAWTWIFLLLPPVGFAGAAFVALRRERLHADPWRLRQTRALETARERVEEAVAELDAGDDAEGVRLLHRALAGYVADRARRPSGGMTAADVRALLAERGVGGEAARSLVQTLERCEAASYGGGASDLLGPAREAPTWLRALEQESLA